MPTPYYQDDAVTIYHGNCREILPGIGNVDLVLTDPPYGIASKWVGGSGHGWENSRAEAEERNSWDSRTPDQDTIEAIILSAPLSIIWGGNYFNLPPARCVLVWNKPERGFTLAEAEIAWTNADNVARVYDGPRRDRSRAHPTQKPIGLMKWCISLSWAKDCRTILDPFMGSGTTLRAAKDLGRKAIGIEIEEKYCEIAAKRMAQEVMF